ncbi:MAG: carbohydrate porin [Oligoflexales bacterium]|nr:carbohydrate porin [Oligoflexales bacterium]
MTLKNKTFYLTLSLITIGLFLNGPLNALEYDGYFRSGIGVSKGDSQQVCYKAVGSEGGIGQKHRFGNECDTYLELGLSEEYRVGRSLTDPSFKAYVRLGFRSQGQRDWESSEFNSKVDSTLDGETVNSELTSNKDSQAVFALREAYVESANFLGPSSSTKAWVGKRFYRRRDLYMLDFYIYENVGPGFGFENIDVGYAKTHFAIMRNTPYQGSDVEETDGPAQTNFDLRQSDIAVPGGGKIELIAIYGQSSHRGNRTSEKRWQSLNGWQGGIVHEQEDFLGGKNMFALQYGRGIYGAINRRESEAPDSGYWSASLINQYGGYGSQLVASDDIAQAEAIKKSSTLRVSDEMIINPSESYSLGAVLFYQQLDFGESLSRANNDQIMQRPDKKELTLGVRPVMHLTDTLDLAFEYGYTQVANAIMAQNNQGDFTFYDTKLQKLTIAPQISSGREFWAYSKPQLRLFYTKAFWDNASKGHVGGDVYKTDLAGWSAGAQVEVWW